MRWLARLLSLILLVLLASCTLPMLPRVDDPPGLRVFDPDTLAGQLSELPQEPGANLGASRLAEGLMPPTNRWFSGLVFGDQPQPVFPLPLSFGLTPDGFAFGLPQVTTSPATIMGSFHPAITIADAGSGWRISAYDEASVTVSDPDGAAVRIAEGSPLVSYTAADAVELHSEGVTWMPAEGYATAEVAGAVYGITGRGVRAAGTRIHVPAATTATWFAVPDGGDAAQMADLAVPVEATDASYRVVNEKAETTLRYRTADERQTVIAVMPHQRDTLTGKRDCSLGTWPSVYGTLTACASTELAWTSPIYPARATLELRHLSRRHADELRAQLVADIASAPAYPSDTYFGGKALYRDAQLWSIAIQLGAMEAAVTLRNRMVAALDRWLDPATCTDADPGYCFVYDTTNRGVVGRVASFGSEEYNDHHFHYGYFLYAAGILAANNPDLAARWAPMLDPLAADIANAPASDLLPQRRTFDVYASHSWASGTSPFGDGNNQESSSEAVNAWVGLTLWAQASGNQALEEQARWMHALEAQAARAYWTDFDTDDPVYAGFGHSISPLNFGGKRDYATWFSPEPAAALAILVIPGSPSSEHLVTDPQRIRANVAEATASGGFDQTYGAYLLLYAVLAEDADCAALKDQARALSDKAIDDGTSRTYVLAFILAACSF
ncbi:MAG: glycosyl hydrolase [Propioniciclava sp.]